MFKEELIYGSIVFCMCVLELRYKREVINPKLLTHFVTMFYYSNIPLFTMFYFWKYMYKIYLYAFTFTL